jgi:hypothetical protein
MQIKTLNSDRQRTALRSKSELFAKELPRPPASRKPERVRYENKKKAQSKSPQLLLPQPISTFPSRSTFSVLVLEFPGMFQIFDDSNLSSNYMEHFYDMPDLPEKTPSLSGGAGRFDKKPVIPPLTKSDFFAPPPPPPTTMTP